ncbi:MAG: hypothetical protein HY720_22250 [Planctomycetes bacterium]|nr:hypothetical protein [Planctomycetota bacterium]
MARTPPAVVPAGNHDAEEEIKEVAKDAWIDEMRDRPNLESCPDCGSAISKSAPSCPKCGWARSPIPARRPTDTHGRKRHRLRRGSKSGIRHAPGYPVESFHGKAWVTFFFYGFGWVFGAILNFVFLSEAKSVKRQTGVEPRGMGCLQTMIWANIYFPAALGLLIVVVVFVIVLFNRLSGAPSQGPATEALEDHRSAPSQSAEPDDVKQPGGQPTTPDPGRSSQIRQCSTCGGSGQLSGASDAELDLRALESAHRQAEAAAALDSTMDDRRKEAVYRALYENELNRLKSERDRNSVCRACGGTGKVNE